MLQGFFMIGFPDETEEEIEATISVPNKFGSE